MTQTEPVITRSALAWNGDWMARRTDYMRHVQDLRSSSYEGALARPDREAVFCHAFDLVTPVAQRVLADLNQTFLNNSGQIRVLAPARVPEGGLIGSWEVSWPALEQAKNRFDGSPVGPLALSAVFPLTATGQMLWTHPHFALLRPCCRDGFACAWPMQVLSPEDARRQEPVLRVLAEAEMHQMTYLSDLNWRVLISFLDESRA